MLSSRDQVYRPWLLGKAGKPFTCRDWGPVLKAEVNFRVACCGRILRSLIEASSYKKGRPCRIFRDSFFIPHYSRVG